jgi:glycosyltransferase involved in cell wall biosynthesis
MVKLSILTPSYNYARFIGSAIDSVFKQESGLDTEHVIQDADSADGTDEVVRRSTTFNRNVRYLQEPDTGQSDGLNRAFQRSRGDLIGWLNADEFYLPGAFGALEKATQAHPDADLFIGDCAFVDEQGRLLRIVPAHVFSRFVLSNYGCFISSCASFFRRKCLDEEPWDLAMRRTMDWDLWLSISKKSKVVYIPKVLAAYRIHDGQVTNVPESKDVKEFDALFLKHGIRRSKIKTGIASLAHVGLKLSSGGYLSQIRSISAPKTIDLSEWSRNPATQEVAEKLVGA